jgi:hypothetical protein
MRSRPGHCDSPFELVGNFFRLNQEYPHTRSDCPQSCSEFPQISLIEGSLPLFAPRRKAFVYQIERVLFGRSRATKRN